MPRKWTSPGASDGREHYAALPEYLSDGTIGFLLYSTALSLKKQFLRALGESGLGITQEQFTLLGLLWDGDGAYQSELAERAYKDRHSVTRIVKGLEARGLVERRPDIRDARLTRCHLTGAGRALCEPLRAVHARHLERSFRGLSGEEVEGLRKTLTRLRRDLQDDEDIP